MTPLITSMREAWMPNLPSEYWECLDEEAEALISYFEKVLASLGKPEQLPLWEGNDD